MRDFIRRFYKTHLPKHLFIRFGSRLALCLSVFAASLEVVSAVAEPTHPFDLSTRGALIDRILSERVETVLPELMRRTGIDSWILVSREYNEDPVLKTFLPSSWFSARRRTILMIFDHGPDQPLETLAVARYAVGKQFKSAWNPESMPDQWQRVRQIIDERAPETIGINVSETFALADGLTKTDYDALADALGPHVTKLKSADALAVGWLETRSQTEVELYPQIVGLAHDLIARAFSLEAITPGKTTTEELEWWLREAAERQNLDLWFHPSISKQSRRQNEATAQAGSTSGLSDVIHPGDLLHVDFGITYLRLNTDTQQHAYLLREGETALPNELQVAFDRGNRLQDILMSQFKAGRSGNEILLASLALMRAEGIEGKIYTHPLGYHGHGAGPTIGLWDQQRNIPGAGDYPLYPRTAFSIELSSTSEVDGWAQDVRIMLEEDAYFNGDKVRFIKGRQTSPILIPSGDESQPKQPNY